MSSHKPSQKNSWVAMGILLVLVYLLLKNIDFAQLIRALSTVSLWLLLPLLGLQLFTQGILAMQWLFITRLFSKKNSFSQMFYILSTGSVIEALTPGAKVGGEVTRLFYLKQECNLTTEEATHIILIQKSISMSVLFAISLGSSFLLTGHIGRLLSPIQSKVLMLGCVLCLAFFLGLIGCSSQMAHFLESTERTQKLGKMVRTYHTSISQLEKKQWLLQFSISIVVWLLFPLKMVLLVKGFGFSLPPLFLFATTMTSYMMGMLPLTPGGLGTFEGTVIAFFSLVNVSIEDSITIAVVFRFITFWFVMLISTIWVVLYRKRGKCGKTI